MDEHLLVLLVPGVEGVPVEPGRAGDPLEGVGPEHPDAAGALLGAGPEAVASDGAAVEALLVAFVHQKTRANVLHGDVVLRVEGVLPDVACPRGVEDRQATQLGPHPPGGGLDTVRLGRHSRIVAVARPRRLRHDSSLECTSSRLLSGGEFPAQEAGRRGLESSGSAGSGAPAATPVIARCMASRRRWSACTSACVAPIRAGLSHTMLPPGLRLASATSPAPSAP